MEIRASKSEKNLTLETMRSIDGLEPREESIAYTCPILDVQKFLSGRKSCYHA